ncbi:MAG: hypothetical protein WKF84_12145 [Pyrinomonadaceae bacterium]
MTEAKGNGEEAQKDAEALRGAQQVSVHAGASVKPRQTRAAASRRAVG